MQITSVTMASKKKLVQGNHVSEKLDSIVTPRGMKTYNEIEVNCEIYSTNLVKMLKISSQALSLSQEVPTTPTKITRDGLFLDDLQTMNHVRYASKI